MNFTISSTLPQGTLSSPWFLIFAAFVGVNTIIYMGLTLSKLFPWPKQIHPRRVRALLGVKEPETLEAAPLAVRVSRESPADSAVHDIAGAFGWLGGVAMLFGSVHAFLIPGQIHDFVAMVIGLALLTIAQVMSRTKCSPAWATWLWTLSVSALALTIALNASLGTLERLGYFLVLAVVIGSVSVTWPSFAFATLVTLGCYVALAMQVATPLDGDWRAPGVTAAIAGFLLQVVRRRSLNILRDVDRLENQLGSTDVLTGALTRQGLITLGPTIRRTAARANQPVFAMIVDVDGLAAHNRAYGTAYGDDLLRTVAEAIRTAARDSDLLGRWSGDEFAIIGMGAEDSIAALTERIPAVLAESPVTLGKTPVRVKIGAATGSATEYVEVLVERALAELEGSADEPDETTDEAA